MLFGKKIERAFHKLREEKEKAMENREEQPESMPELEKHDLLAMIVAALLVILPAALLALGVLALVGYLFFFH